MFIEAKDDGGGGGGDKLTTGPISRSKLQSTHHHQQINIQQDRDYAIGCMSVCQRISLYISVLRAAVGYV